MVGDSKENATNKDSGRCWGSRFYNISISSWLCIY